MFGWLKARKGKAEDQTPLPPKEETVEDATGYFSTHTRKQRDQILLGSILNSMPSPQFKNIQTGEGMDSSGSVTDSPKSNFSVSGQQLNVDLLSWYASQGFIGYQACAIIAQQWLVDKACAMKGLDASRNWFDISVNDGTEVDDDILHQITELDKRFKLKQNLVEADKFKNVFGIRHVLFKVESEDKDYYEKPFNPANIKPGQYKGMSQIDPYWMSPLLTAESVADPSAIDFYEPTYWNISGKKYHKSHFVILYGEEVPDLLKPNYLYGGLPLTQRIYERVYGSERTANEGPLLAMTKRLNVRKVDLKKAVANQEAFEQALGMQSYYRDNYGQLVIGKDEEAEQLETSLTDVDEVIWTQYELVAAIARVPSTKLLGTSPRGFNATGDHEIKTYNQELKTIQEAYFDPIVEKHYQCLMASEIEPEHSLSFEVDFEWCPVDEPEAREVADIKEVEARTAATLQATGAIDAYEIRDKLINDSKSGYNGLESVERPEELEDLEPDTISEEEPAAAEDKATVDRVVKKAGKWYIYSETGEKKLGGPYSRKSQALKRLRQIEYFKEKDG